MVTVCEKDMCAGCMACIDICSHVTDLLSFVSLNIPRSDPNVVNLPST